MDCLTLPRLHPAIPLTRASASAEALFLAELERRCERGHIVCARRSVTAQAVMEATLRKFFNPRGGPSERFFSLAIVLDDQAHYDEGSDMREGEIAWSIFPTDTIRWAHIGAAISHLESLRPGAGETILHAIQDAALAADGILTASIAHEIAGMQYWDGATTDEDAELALQDRGYDRSSEEDGPPLPMQFKAAAGGDLWYAPKKKLGYRALRAALAPLGAARAARLSGLAGASLPRACKAARAVHDVARAERSWLSYVVGVMNDDAMAGNFATRMLDDIDNERANSGASDVLYRCATDQEMPARRRARRSSATADLKPKTGDGLAQLAAQLWVYHYLDLTLGVLVDLQDSLPREGTGESKCN